MMMILKIITCILVSVFFYWIWTHIALPILMFLNAIDNGPFIIIIWALLYIIIPIVAIIIIWSTCLLML